MLKDTRRRSLLKTNKCQKCPIIGAYETYYMRTFESLPVGAFAVYAAQRLCCVLCVCVCVCVREREREREREFVYVYTCVCCKQVSPSLCLCVCVR